MGFYLVEEAHEVKEALDEGSPEKIREELGDLLFQLLTIIEMSAEKGEFDLSHVVEEVREKMVRRHPHVFGRGAVRDSKEVVANWIRIKREEKGKGEERDSILEGIPASIPSLHRAYLLAQRASRVGFDWEDKDGLLKKLDEEIDEFREEHPRGEQRRDGEGDGRHTLHSRQPRQIP